VPLTRRTRDPRVDELDVFEWQRRQVERHAAHTGHAAADRFGVARE
jgi:hypothetical protein